MDTLCYPCWQTWHDHWAYSKALCLSLTIVKSKHLERRRALQGRKKVHSGPAHVVHLAQGKIWLAHRSPASFLISPAVGRSAISSLLPLPSFLICHNI